MIRDRAGSDAEELYRRKRGDRRQIGGGSRDRDDDRGDDTREQRALRAFKAPAFRKGRPTWYNEIFHDINSDLGSKYVDAIMLRFGVPVMKDLLSRTKEGTRIDSEVFWSALEVFLIEKGVLVAWCERDKCRVKAGQDRNGICDDTSCSMNPKMKPVGARTFDRADRERKCRFQGVRVNKEEVKDVYDRMKKLL